MKKKVEGICAKITEVISGWKGILAIIFEGAEDIGIYDPYFNIDIDVYYDKVSSLPQERREYFNCPGGFETSPVFPVDRFLINDLPVTVNYKNRAMINRLIDRVEKGVWTYRTDSTSHLYRIKKGQVLYSQGDWLEGIRKRLKKIPKMFWEKLMEDARFVLDQSLNNMGAAVFRQDHLFYRISAASFIQSLCTYIFGLNSEFAPSGQLLYEHIRELKDTPEDFKGRFESFIRSDIKLNPKKRYELAQLLAKSISRI